MAFGGSLAGFDLDAYFERIGYQGSLAPTLDTLAELHVRHPAAIPFENLNPLLDLPVRLDPAALDRKLVRGGRGGWCFEHNLLFGRALARLGFAVTGLAARVLWQLPEDAINPRTHMGLRIELNGRPYFADVGFGGQALTGPLRLEPDIEQATPHEPFRLLTLDDGFKLQSKIAGAWHSLYRFDLSTQFALDYELPNYWLSTNPDSIFRHVLMVARAIPGRRYALRNNQLSAHALNGATTEETLTDIAGMRRTLTELFGLSLPDAPELDNVLQKLIA